MCKPLAYWHEHKFKTWTESVLKFLTFTHRLVRVIQPFQSHWHVKLIALRVNPYNFKSHLLFSFGQCLPLVQKLFGFHASNIARAQTETVTSINH